MWSPAGILNALTDAIRREDDRLTEEQAVYGIDALDELGLHPVLAAGLIEAGFGVQREVLYPGEHTAPVRKSARARCDLVILPEPGMALRDPAAEQALLAASENTLFRGVAHAMAETSPSIGPADAYWLEAKAIVQHALTDAGPVWNTGYAHRLVKGPAADLVKLGKDASIWHGGALVVLCCASEAVARHDLAAVAHRCLDADLPLSGIEISGTPIQDRIGNAWCGLGLLTLRTSG